MRPSQLLATALTLSSLVAAWPWRESMGDVEAVDQVPGIFRRQDDNESSAPTTTAQTGTAPKTTAPTATATDDSNSSTDDASSGTATTGSGTAKTTAKATGTQKTTTTGKGSNASSNATATDYDPRLPAGGIQMVTPAAISGSQFYKVGDFVTFGWNYTSLSATPTAIDILASCSANQATYTLAMNQSVEQTGVIWDTGNFQKTAETPLLTETYTLIIYDADSSVSATAKAGYLAPYKQYQFGMYLPQQYSDWTGAAGKCPTCVGNGALSERERQTLGVVLGVATVTVLSFTWFANGFGLI